MRFYSDIEATLGVWDGNEMLEFVNGVYETTDQREIELLKKAGYRYDIEKPEKKSSGKQQGE